MVTALETQSAPRKVSTNPAAFEREQGNSAHKWISAHPGLCSEHYTVPTTAPPPFELGIANSKRLSGL